MTKTQLLKEIGLDDDTIIYEFVETERLFYVLANKEKANEFSNFTTGEYAKWKNKGKWFSPSYPADINVYDEISKHKNMLSKLK